MATTQLDQEVVERLVSIALSGLSGVTFVPRGRRQPPASTTAAKWCRLIKVTCDGIGRVVNEGEVDRADVVIVVSCYANAAATKANAHAIQDCMNRVAAILAPQRLIDSPLTHVLTTGEARTEPDADPGDDKMHQSGVVTVTGVAERVG